MFEKIRKYLPGKWGNTKTEIPVVRLQGPIGMATPLRPGLSMATASQPLEKAFAFKNAPAVAIIVNSPGGSPVQSRLIYSRIRALAKENDKQVLVFVEDVAASGGYMISLAGDEIIADPTSIVGSIGVVSAGFGFQDMLQKIGVERRVYTAGEKKVTLDPFKEEDPGDVAHLKALQQDIHEVFIDMVKERRSEVLSDDPDLFSGQFWTGRAARDLGLVDHLGDLRSVIRSRYGEDAVPKLISAPKGIFGRKSGVGGVASAFSGTDGLGREILSAAEERMLWNRFGL